MRCCDWFLLLAKSSAACIDEALICAEGHNASTRAVEVVNEGALADPVNNNHPIAIACFDPAQRSIYGNGVGSSRCLACRLEYLRLEYIKRVVT